MSKTSITPKKVKPELLGHNSGFTQLKPKYCEESDVNVFAIRWYEVIPDKALLEQTLN